MSYLKSGLLCNTCGNISLFMCSGCRAICYCCIECQRNGWKIHKKDCKWRRENCGLEYLELVDHPCEHKQWNSELEKQGVPYRIIHEKESSSDYSIDKKIGKGGFGEVYRVIKHGIRYAMKTGMKIAENQFFPNYIMNEVYTRFLVHPNIMTICSCIIECEQKWRPVKHNTISLVSELAQSDLVMYSEAEYKRKKHMSYGAFNNDDLAIISFQIINAVAYCYSRLVHNEDLKTENFLIGGQEYRDKKGRLHIVPRVMLGDFGISTSLCTHQNGYYSSSGTQVFQAPEKLLGDYINTSKNDVWSCGAILYELATKQMLSNALLDVPLHIFNRFGFPNEQTWPGVTKLPKWSSAYEIPHHIQYTLFENEIAFFMKDRGSFVDLLRQMLKLNPDERITIYDALNHPYFTVDKLKDQSIASTPAEFVYKTIPGSKITINPKLNFMFDQIPLSPEYLITVFKELEHPLIKCDIEKNELWNEFYYRTVIIFLSLTDTLEKYHYKKYHNMDYIPLSNQDLLNIIFTGLSIFRWIITTIKNVIQLSDLDYRLYLSWKIAGVIYSVAVYRNNSCKHIYYPMEFFSDFKFANVGEFAKLQKLILILCDLDIMRPNVFDFLQQYIRINRNVINKDKGREEIIYILAIILLSDISTNKQFSEESIARLSIASAYWDYIVKDADGNFLCDDKKYNKIMAYFKDVIPKFLDPMILSEERINIRQIPLLNTNNLLLKIFLRDLLS